MAMGFAISNVSAGFSAPPDTVPLRLDVTLSKAAVEGNVRLDVKLTNTSQEVVTLDELDLPWIAPNELEFLNRAYRPDALQSELSKKGPMEDYFGRTINLQPGQSIAGALQLTRYFSGLNEALKHSDVIVEWNCRSRTRSFICNDGMRRSILLPKKRAAQKKRTHTTPSRGGRR
jgi:hypothetical protein